ncbi:class II aldolase/adducin family protein [Streptomyces sp. WZ-12]|uniref:class II aldolase/adducin family protein n=1 Tax=Streptomyces sp. WZ-12 TaxID=3030210 RepID=UPI0023810789|nr:class II aldolase/adducin family protein [Streptomyces sp. WZ-12]
MEPVIISAGSELLRENLAAAGRDLHRRGWLPGASGHLSARSGEAVLLTVDGVDRGALTRDDIVLIEPGEGLPLLGEVEWPPADACLHLALYRGLPDCGAVIQAAPPHTTELSTAAHTTGAIDQVTLGGPELETTTDELGTGDDPDSATPATLPIVTTWPDLPHTTEVIADHLARHPQGAPPALLIAGYGVLAWGRDLETARARLTHVEELGRLTRLTATREADTADAPQGVC